MDSDGVDSTIVDAFKAKNMALTADITNGAGNISTCEVDGVTYYTPNSMAQYRAWEDAKIAKTGNGHGAVLQFWVWQDEGDFGTLGFAQRWHVDNTWFVADGIQLYYAKDKCPDINIDTPIAVETTYAVTLAEGTEDGDKWTVKVGEGEAKAFPVEGLDGGETVTVTYSGTKRVKSVKAVKKAEPATVPVTVTWNNDDITGSGNSFTKDGVTITVGDFIDFNGKNFYGGGTFTTTLGNFTKIEVSGGGCEPSDTGWSGSTWTGNASSVSYSDGIYGYGNGNLKFVFTIEPKN